MRRHQSHRAVELSNLEQESERRHEQGMGDGRSQKMVGDHPNRSEISAERHVVTVYE